MLIIQLRLKWGQVREGLPNYVTAKVSEKIFLIRVFKDLLHEIVQQDRYVTGSFVTWTSVMTE